MPVRVGRAHLYPRAVEENGSGSSVTRLDALARMSVDGKERGLALFHSILLTKSQGWELYWQNKAVAENKLLLILG